MTSQQEMNGNLMALMASMEARINSISQERSALPPPAPLTVLATHPKSIAYNGDKLAYAAWKAQCELAILARPHLVEIAKVEYIRGALTGTALDWLNRLATNPTLSMEVMQDSTKFWNLMDKEFTPSPTDLTLEKEFKLLNFSTSNGNMSAFIDDFNRLAGGTGRLDPIMSTMVLNEFLVTLPDKALNYLLVQFGESLKSTSLSRIQEVLKNLSQSDSWQWVDAKDANPATQTPWFSQFGHASPDDPMVIASMKSLGFEPVKKGISTSIQLTADEVKKRRDRNACTFCGKRNHVFANCFAFRDQFGVTAGTLFPDF